MGGQQPLPEEWEHLAPGRLLTPDSTDEGSRFVAHLGYYVAVAAAIILGFGLLKMRAEHLNRTRRSTRRTEVGLFAHSSWPKRLRDPVAFVLMLVLVVPTLLCLISVVLGLVMCAKEGWTPVLGIEYAFSNALGLSSPLTDVQPTNTIGRVFASVLSILSVIFVNVAIGIAARLTFMSDLIKSMPQSNIGFLRCMFIYAPFFFVVSALTSGVLMSSIEDWDIFDGFLYMVSAFAGLSNPLTPDAPQTSVGCLLEVMCLSLELALGSAIIGIVCSHPLIGKLVRYLEGAHMEQQPMHSVRSKSVAKVAIALRKEAGCQTESVEQLARESTQGIDCQLARSDSSDSACRRDMYNVEEYAEREATAQVIPTSRTHKPYRAPRTDFI